MFHIFSSYMRQCSFIGATMNVILELSYTVCIWISATVAIIYTLLGGLYSVAYTDIIQLTLIFFSMVSFFLRNKTKIKIFQNLKTQTFQGLLQPVPCLR